MHKSVRLSLVVIAVSMGCRSSPPATVSGAPISLQGAGATFPYPLYSKWVAEYQKRDPRVRINYQSIGSGGGIRQITERTVDFGASDAPMNDDELGRAPAKLIHVPTALGAVVVTYNLPGVSGLKLSAELIAAVFLGEISSWADPMIAAANPGLKLPAGPLMVTYRSDGSGTTAVFTEYLAKVSPAWKEKVGSGKSVKFPVGLGAKGNEGVAGQIKATPGSLGYVELAYAKQAGLAFALVQNRAKAFVAPSVDSVKAAAAAVADTIPDDLRVSIVDPPGADAYPIASFTYILAYAAQPDAVKGKALAQFLWWAIHDGQLLAPGLDYAPLPAALALRIEAKLKLLEANGAPLL
ncbi:MAG: phosphate ABC transporter substrate-binding protein PstS [Deltaproteobacteria bacterium]|nr:phosphate ABC transporter substrate-binding protein PstS [Deltaproteobacteria bacterium]